jgi:hypothetical protein
MCHKKKVSIKRNNTPLYPSSIPDLMSTGKDAPVRCVTAESRMISRISCDEGCVEWMEVVVGEGGVDKRDGASCKTLLQCKHGPTILHGHSTRRFV